MGKAGGNGGNGRKGGEEERRWRGHHRGSRHHGSPGGPVRDGYKTKDEVRTEETRSLGMETKMGEWRSSEGREVETGERMGQEKGGDRHCTWRSGEEWRIEE